MVTPLKPKLQDVARRAKVSIATASRALNGDPRVHAVLRRQVLNASTAVGYRPNALARGLRTQRTDTVGVVIPTIANPHFTEAVQAAQDALAAAGYTTIVTNAARDPEAELRDLLALRAGRVDGLLLAPSQTDAARLVRLLDGGLEVVLMDRRIEGVPWDWVAVDVAGGVRAAVQHLAERGRRRIGFIAGPAGISTADEKLAGYASAMREMGLALDESLVESGEYTEAGGRAAAERLLSRRPAPDALIATNNLSTLGMVQTARACGVRVPEDVALIGFDNTAWTGLVTPALTVVSQPVAELGATAAQLLLRRLSATTGSLERRREVLPTTLVIREST